MAMPGPPGPKPKKPSNGYVMWCQAMGKRDKKDTRRAEDWENLGEADKEFYLDKAKGAFKKWGDDVRIWREHGGEEEEETAEVKVNNSLGFFLKKII